MSIDRALRMCGIVDGESFSVAVIEDGNIRPRCFTDANEATQWLNTTPGNRYLCGNVVKPGITGKPKEDDIITGRVQLIDADPTGDDIAAARAAILELAAWLGTHGARPGVVFSGRGSQAWVRTDGLAKPARIALGKGLAARFGRAGVKFDATPNFDRLMRMPGYINTKTGLMAEILDEGNGIPITPELLASLALPVVPDHVSSDAPFDVGQPTEIDLALITGEIKQLWDTPGEGDRSKRDFRLVLLLLRNRATEAQACRLLYAMPGSKAAVDKRGAAYWTATLESVHRHLEHEAALRARATGLPDASVADPGAPFEPGALEALAFVRAEDSNADWQRLIARFKRAKVGIKNLNDALKTYTKQVDGRVHLRYVGGGVWYAKTWTGWSELTAAEVGAIHRTQGQDFDAETKKAILNQWKIVNEPFEPEDLDGGRWNKDGAQLAIAPVEGEHPTWDMLLAHIGKNLDVSNDEWCKASEITSGAQYLLTWIGAMFQRPKARTAFLFIHGDQEAGKSTLHEALRPLFTKGYVEIKHALTSKAGFNGELANGILCVIEELDLSGEDNPAHERIKEWVTSEMISVRRLYHDAFMVANYSHFIHCVNKLRYIPASFGDTRITEIHVDRPENPMPKYKLHDMLRAELPAFAWTAKNVPMPMQTGRLFIPAIQTKMKLSHTKSTKSALDTWLDTATWGDMTDAQMVGAFLSEHGGDWDKARVMRELPADVIRLRMLMDAISKVLTPGVKLSAANLMDIQRDFTHPIGLGRALTKLASHSKRLRSVTVTGAVMWMLWPTPPGPDTCAV